MGHAARKREEKDGGGMLAGAVGIFASFTSTRIKISAPGAGNGLVYRKCKLINPLPSPAYISRQIKRRGHLPILFKVMQAANRLPCSKPRCFNRRENLKRKSERFICLD
jgi:hypothetical protein